jgi:hypothetical protein
MKPQLKIDGRCLVHEPVLDAENLKISKDLMTGKPYLAYYTNMKWRCQRCLKELHAKWKVNK